MSGGELETALDGYRPQSEQEARDLARVRRLVDSGGDPWDRSRPLHVTGSAVVIHPPTGRVLLRWHERMGSWLQVGGHGDPGETDPLAVALREAEEETGLTDLAPWSPLSPLSRPASPVSPSTSPLASSTEASLIHLAIVSVPAGRNEPAHEHADVRYVLATGRPEEARPEKPSAQVRWLALGEAIEAVAEDNLADSLRRLLPLIPA